MLTLGLSIELHVFFRTYGTYLFLCIDARRWNHPSCFPTPPLCTHGFVGGRVKRLGEGVRGNGRGFLCWVRNFQFWYAGFLALHLACIEMLTTIAYAGMTNSH